MRPSPRNPDSRVVRTREALQSAFILLAMDKPYDEVRIDEILDASGVGRSTFYEHFSGKEALLAASMDGAMSVLAGVPTATTDRREVVLLLEHFWQNRVLARSLFQGRALVMVRKQLTSLIEVRLGRIAADRWRLPHRLAARALADVMLSPIVAWLAGEARCTPANLADALGASSRATHAGLVTARDG